MRTNRCEFVTQTNASGSTGLNAIAVPVPDPSQQATRDCDVIVAGAGAAGLVAATEAARAGASVVLLEKNDQPGLKILISGGGRCNLTTALSVRAAEAEFGPQPGRFLRHALRTTPPETIRRWVEDRGVETVVEAQDKVFPRSGRSRDVRDALVARAVEAGVELWTRCPMVGPPARAESGWVVETARGVLRCRRLVLAIGGSSYPKTGTCGEGYRWLEHIGLDVDEPRPALAPLASDAPWVHELCGVTLADVECQLRAETGKIVHRRRRPLLFTHRGVSGPGPMDLSRYVEREPGVHRLFVDLLPDAGGDELERVFAGRGKLGNRLRAETGLPRRLCRAIVAIHGLTGVPAAEIAGRSRRRILSALRGLEVPVTGSLGFAHAEVTTGGLPTRMVDPTTFEVQGHAGLFVVGELVDVDGPIGGFSFLIAFASGVLAGRAAARG